MVLGINHLRLHYQSTYLPAYLLRQFHLGDRWALRAEAPRLLCSATICNPSEQSVNWCGNSDGDAAAACTRSSEDEEEGQIHRVTRDGTEGSRAGLGARTDPGSGPGLLWLLVGGTRDE